MVLLTARVFGQLRVVPLSFHEDAALSTSLRDTHTHKNECLPPLVGPHGAGCTRARDKGHGAARAKHAMCLRPLGGAHHGVRRQRAQSVIEE